MSVIEYCGWLTMVYYSQLFKSAKILFYSVLFSNIGT